MLDRLMRRSRRPSGRDLQVLFAATIVLPGVLLAVVGIRAWMQERRLAEQQMRDRVERAADLAQRAFEQDLRGWQSLLERISKNAPPQLASLDESVRAVFSEPGAAAIVMQAQHGPVIWPERQSAYALGSPDDAAVAVPTSPLLAAAEHVEIRDQQHDRAIALYRDAISRLPPGTRAPGLMRLARTLRKAGREQEAMAIYRDLSLSRERMGVVPVELLARHELCVLFNAGRPATSGECRLLDLYRDLVEGRWHLPMTRYLFYSESVQRMLNASTARSNAAHWIGIEQKKIALTEAARSRMSVTDAADMDVIGAISVIRSRAAPGVALLLSRRWLAASRWPQTFRPVVSAGFRVDVHDPQGDVWFDSSTGPHSAGTTGVTRQPEMAGATWRLRTTPLDPTTLMADVQRWRTLTLVMLLLLVALLAFGTYLTTRVVRREIEVACLQSDFVSTVSHEFRSPLTGIRQLGEMLLRGRVPDGDRRQEYYERITREADRLSRLVENLLDVAQMEAGRKEYRFARVDTTGWLRGVVDEARANPGHRQPTIEACIPEALPALNGDKDALSSALHNLLDNAIKYSPGTEAVWCEAEARDGQVTIRVRDRGVGMSDEDRHVVFERFRRGHGPITEQVKGTGLGLSLVDHIVRAHGGRIECDTRLGEGTTFSIHLAAASADTGA